MAERRASRISDIPTSQYSKIQAGRDGEDRFGKRVKTKATRSGHFLLPAPPHPALTDFGPDSLQKFMRQEIERTRSERLVQKTLDLNFKQENSSSGTTTTCRPQTAAADLQNFNTSELGGLRGLDRDERSGDGEEHPSRSQARKRATTNPFSEISGNGRLFIEGKEKPRPQNLDGTHNKLTRRQLSLRHANDSKTRASNQQKQMTKIGASKELLTRAELNASSSSLPRRRSSRLSTLNVTDIENINPTYASELIRPESPLDQVRTTFTELSASSPQRDFPLQRYLEDCKNQQLTNQKTQESPRRSRHTAFKEHVDAKRRSYRSADESERDIDDPFQYRKSSNKAKPIRVSKEDPKVSHDKILLDRERGWKESHLLSPERSTSNGHTYVWKDNRMKLSLSLPGSDQEASKRDGLEEKAFERDSKKRMAIRFAKIAFRVDEATGSSQKGRKIFSTKLGFISFPKIGKAKHTAQSRMIDNIPSSSSFQYFQIVPEILPGDFLNLELSKSNKKSRRCNSDTQISDQKAPKVIQRDSNSSLHPLAILQDRRLQLLYGLISSRQGLFRRWDIPELPTFPSTPPDCAPREDSPGWPDNIPPEVYDLICTYLSHNDVRNLRLVNHAFAEELTPVLFCSVVTQFNESMFDTNKANGDENVSDLPTNSPFYRVGHHINKFAISFEVDLSGLQNAEAKVIQKQQKDWFGQYLWPVSTYPRFAALQALEDLSDNNRMLLKRSLELLEDCSELGLSIDSGHGWLNGPDLSDMQLYDRLCDYGTKIFGKAFGAEDRWHVHGRNQLLKWGQQNTINNVLTNLLKAHRERDEDHSSDIRYLRTVSIRDLDSFKLQATQPDFVQDAHTGARTFGVDLAIAPLAGGALHGQQNGPPADQQNLQQQNNLGIIGARSGGRRCRKFLNKARSSQEPQWPIIYNGFNLAADVGGACSFIQTNTDDPRRFPLQPGHLTEAQAQWLLETVWAQRAFLSAYTTSIILNQGNLRTVHSLHIGKLSSGLLPSLALHEFWRALPALKKLKILISPDWRTEHIYGDRLYNMHMRIAPVQASIKFAEFLNRYISRIEKLTSLTIGFVGGGENASGLLARNDNILPAPITSNPRAWLIDHSIKPDLATMLKFNHIKDLTFENCWFSPSMLKAFMAKSRDTSLRHLSLDSVSLAGRDGTHDSPVISSQITLRPLFEKDFWLHERLPESAYWTRLLDEITPGRTFFERKAAAGMLSEEEIEKSPRQHGFRGNVAQITLKSVGYVKISGISSAEFNQKGVVTHDRRSIDPGLNFRRMEIQGNPILLTGNDAQLLASLVNNINNPNANAATPGQNQTIQGLNLMGQAEPNVSTDVFFGSRVTMNRFDPEAGTEYFGLGRMTQCVHPIEKRVLEQAWGMRFGWGDDLKRWSAVEDGCFEGGTGRFSGVITKGEEEIEQEDVSPEK